ncbi:MAG: hypothetical protein ACTHMJ_04260 [Thermomicrobiales bacterium]
MSEQESGAGGKFDPSRHLRQLRGKGGASDYLDVKWRLVWLRAEHPDAHSTTEHVTLPSDLAIFKARVTIPDGGSATGYGSETARDFGDFIEKAETKALGRALIALGYGTQFAQEFGEDDVVDVAVQQPGPRGGETLVRPAAAPPQAAPSRLASTVPVAPRPEPIPADLRRPTPVRPLREAEPEQPVAASLAPPVEPPRRPVETRAEAHEESAPPGEPPTSEVPVRRLSRPAQAQPVVRPAPRSTAPAPAARDDETTETGEIDLANYGWTEFWSWARARGFSDRKSLDAVVGRSTTGMTPLEIRRHIQAKQGD